MDKENIDLRFVTVLKGEKNMASRKNIENLIPDELKEEEFKIKIEEDDEDENLVLDVEMEDGVKRECQVLCIYEVEGQNYAALLPIEQFDGVDEGEEVDAEVFFYRYDENGDDIELSTLESDEEFNMVRGIFEQIMG